MTGVNNSSHGPQALRDLMDVCDQLHVVSSRLWDTDRELVSLEKKRVTIVSDRKGIKKFTDCSLPEGFRPDRECVSIEMDDMKQAASDSESVSIEIDDLKQDASDSDGVDV
eukprot:900327_1